MTITAHSGPIFSFGITQGSTGNVTQYNEQRGPSMFDLGQATMDPRYQFSYTPGESVTNQTLGLWDNTGLVDYIPFTATTSGIATQTPTAGSALTLTPISSLGFFSTTIVAPETGLSVSVIAIDSTASILSYGSAGTAALWNPAGGTGRTVVVVNSSNANTEQYIVRGRDMYGFKMTETISASTTSSGTGTGKKAFKYIQSITASTATTISATGVSIGFSDIYGMPLKMPYLGGVSVWVSTGAGGAGNSILLTSANTVIAATQSAQTATTPDVRGTYATSIATNGTSANISSTGIAANLTSTGVRITIQQSISPVALAAITPTDTSLVFGATQFSDF